MKLKKTLPLLFAILLTIIIVSCSDTTTGPADDNRTPGKPDSAAATTTNDTTLRVKWKASIDENDSAFVGYIIKMTGDDNTISIDTVTANFNPLQVTGLNAGTIYTFEIFSLFSNGNMSASTVVSWSPAFRFEKSADGVSSIKLYETASSLGSGIDIYDGDTKSPKTLTVANGEFWTLGLDTRNDEINLASPTEIDYNYPGTPGYTEISQDYWIASSLNDIYDSQALSVATFEPMTVPLHQFMNSSNNLILIIRTKKSGNNDFNYAKVLVKKQSGGWLAGDAPNRYIEIEVSYQAKTEVPYAKIPF